MLSSLLIPSSCFWNFSLYYGLKNAACYDRSLLHHECFTSHPLRMTRCEPSKSEAKWKTKTTPSSSFSSLWCLIAGSNQTIVLLIDGIFSWSHSVCDLLVLKAQDLLRILLEFYSSCYMTGSLTETAQLPQYHWDGVKTITSPRAVFLVNMNIHDIAWLFFRTSSQLHGFHEKPGPVKSDICATRSTICVHQGPFFLNAFDS